MSTADIVVGGYFVALLAVGLAGDHLLAKERKRILAAWRQELEADFSGRYASRLVH